MRAKNMSAVIHPSGDLPAMNAHFADRMTHVRPSAIRQLLELAADPSVISFGGGYPDASLFPVEQLNRVYQSAIAENGHDTLQYTVSNGIPKLREQIAQRMRAQGVACHAENVLILQGSQQGLDLAAKLFINRGDTIITENPTFVGALIAFNPYEPRYQGIAMDEDGMDMDALEAALKAAPGAKLVYTVPDFQNPTGVTLSLARRQRLLALASQYDFYILEDSPYRDIRFQGEAIPTIKSMDKEERVIYLGSFSKILAPGLRLGWAVASEALIQQLGLLKLAADTQCSTLNMHAVSDYLESCDVDAHIAVIRERYRHKKDLMLATMRETFPASVSFTEPDGGLFTWLTFPAGFDADAFMMQELLPKAKVAYVPGATFFPVTQETNHARVNYSMQTDEAIVTGVRGMGRLLREQLR